MQVTELLQNIYSKVFVEFAAMSPMFVSGEIITSNIFRTKLDELVKSSNIYKNTN